MCDTLSALFWLPRFSSPALPMSEVQYRNVAFAVALKTTVIATVLVILGFSGWAPWLRLIGSGVGLVVVAVIASWYTDRQQRSLRRGERIVFSLGVGLAVCLPFIGHEHFWFLVSLGALGTVISAVWGEWISRPADRND